MALIEYEGYEGGTETPLLRYVLFSGMTYYPSEGVKDLRFTADTVEELRATKLVSECDCYEWWQIVDRDTLRIVDSDEGVDR